MRWVSWTAVLLACTLTPHAVFAGNPNEVPFKLYRGYAIVVRGSVGNVKNLNFLVDTGAVPSVLDKRLARKLKLTGTTQRLSVFTKGLETERVVASNVRVGPQQANVLPVVVQDLSFADEALGVRLDAMIGFDFLSQGPFTIDFESKKIVFGPIDPSLSAIQYEAHPGYALVTMRVQQRAVRLVIDTGASDLVLFNTASHDWLKDVEDMGNTTWSNMGGEIRVQKVYLRDAYIGSTSWGTDKHISSLTVTACQPGWTACWALFR